MAIIQFPQQKTSPSFSSSFGAGFGEGLGSGISSLIDIKLQKMQQQQQVNQAKESLTPYLGKDKAEAIAPLTVSNPQLASELLKDAIEGPGRMAYSQAITGLPASEQIPALGAVNQPLQQSPFSDQKMAIVTPPKPKVSVDDKPISSSKIAKKLNTDIERMRSFLPRVNKKDIPKLQQQIDKKEERLEKIVFKEKEIEEKGKQFKQSQNLQEKKFKLQEKKYLNEMDAQKRKEARADQKDIDMETKEVYKKIIEQSKAARENDMRLNRMEKINDEGQLGGTLFNSLIGTITEGAFGIGLDLTSLMTADAQEFKKLSTDFLKNVKSVFGARVTQQEVKMYLQTIPTLMQSKDGRDKVIQNLKAFNKANKIRFNTMNDLIEKNNGRRPRNLSSEIEKRVASKLDNLAEKFKDQGLGPKRGKLGRLKDLIL